MDTIEQCWTINSKKRYPNIWNGKKSVAAHRFYYEEHKGKIPTGMVIDHLCRNTRCINPHHLEAVSQKENVMRSNGIAKRNSEKTHCDFGHPFFGANLIFAQGKRRCRECVNRRARESYWRRNGS